MRTKVLLALSVAVLMSGSLSAAIRYDFSQSSRSEVRDVPSGQVHGTVVIDGDQSRIDLKGKTYYGQDAYILAFASSKRMVIVDPANKTTAELNLANVANALTAARITIANLKKDFKKLPDHLDIAGVPTDHYRLEASYDMTLMFGEIPLTQNVHTTIEKWTTLAFGDVADAMASSLMKSGNVQLDELLENETLQMKGLPVRQVVSITTGPTSARKATVASRNVAATRKQMTEILVSNISVVPSNPSLFVVPSDYHRIESTEPQETIHNLTLAP